MLDRARLTKWLKALAKLAILALLAWMIRGTLQSAFAQLENHTWHIAWPWLLVAAGLYLAGIVPNALFWAQVIAATDHPVGIYGPVRAFFVSAIGKYMPGKAMVLIIRASLMRHLGVSGTIVTVAVFYETLNNMAVGAAVALCILLPHMLTPDLWNPTAWAMPQWMTVSALGMLLVTGLPIVPPVFKLALRYSGLKRFDPTAVAKLHLIGPRVLLVGWAILVVGWWIQGLSLWAVLHALDEPTAGLAHWPGYTAVMAMAVVAGFLALLPAGVGAREFVTIELLKMSGASDTSAVVAAIVLRLVSVVADVGVSSILYLIPPADAAAGELPSPSDGADRA